MIREIFLSDRRRLIFFALCVFSLLIVKQSISSEIRVNALSYPGLLSDEEVDIALNPATLTKLKTSRVYSGGASFDADFGSDEYYKQEGRAGYIGYVWLIDSSWMGIKYQPSVNLVKSNISQYKENNLTNLLIHAGFPISEKISYGIRLSGSSSEVFQKTSHEYWNGDYEENYRYREYQGDLGFLYMTSRGNNLGIVISGTTYRLTDWSTYHGVVKLRIFPEWALTKKNALKGIIDFEIYKYNSQETGNIFGLAWNYHHSPTFLLALTMYQPWYINGHLAGGFIQAGVEKEIFHRLTARTSLRVPVGHGVIGEKILTFGLGCRITEIVNVDFGFREQRNYSFYLPNKNGNEISIAGTYYFTDEK